MPHELRFTVHASTLTAIEDAAIEQMRAFFADKPGTFTPQFSVSPHSRTAEGITLLYQADVTVTW